jgi:hypothetical protein
MWIQLKAIKRILVNGKNETRYPGDWVNVGKQSARRWIADGAAWDPNADISANFPDESGILVIGNKVPTGVPIALDSIPVKTGLVPYMPWKHTLIWNPTCPIQSSLVNVGLGFLDVWDVAMPLWDYDVLAKNVGTKKDQEKTKAVVRDLRVPIYDTRLIFIRQGRITERLLETWMDEIIEGGDTRLAFLRAFYQVKPLMLALPVTWGDSRKQAIV